MRGDTTMDGSVRRAATQVMGLWMLCAAVMAHGCTRSVLVEDYTGDDSADAQRRAQQITYYEHVKPILDAKCVGCHTEGGIGPMPLEAAEDVQEWAAQIEHAVVTRRMPPWNAGPDCNEYVADRSLSQSQIDLVSDWVEQGAALGDPDDEGEPLETDSAGMERVDLTLEMSEPYTPQESPDEYRCFVMEWPLVEPQFITGIDVVPGRTPIVHHAIAYMVTPDSVANAQRRDADDPGPGYSCAGSLLGEWLTSWEPGGHGIRFPHDTGIEVEPGSALILQIHYNTLFSEGGPDKSAVTFQLADTVRRPATTLTHLNVGWAVGGMPIPAGERDVRHSYESAPALLRGPFEIFWADIHMHALGSKGALSLTRSDGSHECLLRVDDYRFEYQETYLLKEPVRVERLDQLRVECHWDNTAENQIVVDGERLEPRDVNWGDGTTDEMCLGNFLISPL